MSPFKTITAALSFLCFMAALGLSGRAEGEAVAVAITLGLFLGFLAVQKYDSETPQEASRKRIYRKGEGKL